MAHEEGCYRGPGQDPGSAALVHQGRGDRPALLYLLVGRTRQGVNAPLPPHVREGGRGDRRCQGLELSQGPGIRQGSPGPALCCPGGDTVQADTLEVSQPANLG